MSTVYYVLLECCRRFYMEYGCVGERVGVGVSLICV